MLHLERRRREGEFTLPVKPLRGTICSCWRCTENFKSSKTEGGKRLALKVQLHFRVLSKNYDESLFHMSSWKKIKSEFTKKNTNNLTRVINLITSHDKNESWNSSLSFVILEDISNVQFWGIKTFCSLGHILNLGVLGHFALENKTREIVKIHEL